MQFSSLPFPIRIAVFVAGGVILLAIGAKVPLLVMVGAITCWVLTGMTVVYSAGIYRGAGQLPMVGKVVQRMALPNASAPRRGAASAAAAAVKVATVDRAAAARRAEQQLKAISGEHPAVQSIFETIMPLAKTRARQKRRALGAERAWFAVIHGPVGVGKSTIGKALAELLIGLDAAAKPIVVPLGSPSPGRFENDWRETLESGLEGVVFVDNAGWLADKNALTQGANGEDFLGTVNSVAEAYPGKLIVVVTMTTEQRELAFSSVKSKDMLRRLTVVDLPCVPLADSDLSKIFETYLGKQELSVDPTLEPKVTRMIRRQREFAGDRFDYAETSRRMAEKLSMRLAPTGQARVSDADLAALALDMDQEN